MVAWEVLGVAVLVAVSLIVCWAVNAWGRSQYVPRFLRGAAPQYACRASGALGPLTITPLPAELRSYYEGACHSTEAAFWFAPRVVVHDLDLLLADALRACGYPVETFEHNVASILPAAPRVVEDYRTAHSIALANESDIASAPDLRLAMFHYHSLLEALLDEGPHRLTGSQR